MVEFALMGPILFLFIAAIVEAGLLMNAQATLDNATRDAVRWGALCGNASGTWTAPDGTEFAASGSPCPAAMTAKVVSEEGILNITAAAPGINPSAPTAGSDASCGNTGAAYGYHAPAGCLIQLNVNYQYYFFFNFLFGSNAPAISLSSTATAVSQR